MDIISSKAHFRQRVVKRSYKIGVTKASYYYKVSRNAIYEWRNKYDGTVKSLRDGSHKPHHHPKEHTQAEKDMILRRYNRYEGDLIRMWDALRENGYSRHYNSMLRVIRKWVKPEIRKRRRNKLKEYARAEYPGQKVQVDVKFVPSECIVDGKKYYEFPAPIREIQTDNGTEFTKQLITNNPKNLTSFEKLLKKCGIIYHRIRVATPRHNGKVERQHREDQKRFYKKLRMFNLEDGQMQLERYNRISNNISKTCLGFRSPNAVMQDYLQVMA